MNINKLIQLSLSLIVWGSVTVFLVAAVISKFGIIMGALLAIRQCKWSEDNEPSY